jgi:phosphoribosyl-ATP pyrophosphohydrolase
MLMTNKMDDIAVIVMLSDAMEEAEKAMVKYPQPNYVITKVAEEAGEVVKAAVHCAEGRETPENVRKEIVQAIAMLIRLYIEGDKVHGLPSIVEYEKTKPEEDPRK